MLDPTSRYYALPTTTTESPDGRQVTYVRRRFLPRGAEIPVAGEVRVQQGERLDQIAARYFGQGEQFWRLADANDAMDPDTLVSEPGSRLRIPLAQAQALIGQG